MALSVGETAPDFDAIDDAGQRVKFSELLNGEPIVVYFYPKDETPGCTAEACTFRDNWDEINKLGAQVIGVSSDSPESHRKFKEHHKLQFRLISDEDNEIRKKYGVKGKLIPPRTTFIISGDRKIVHVFNSQMNFRKHVEESLSTLQSLKKS